MKRSLKSLNWQKLEGWLAVLFLIIIICIVGGVPQHFYWQQRPGALLERHDYSTVVYVLVFPDAKTTKNYRLPGVITRESTCDPNGDFDNQNDPCRRVYNLGAIKWPNGGVSYFDACEIKSSDSSVANDRALGIGCEAQDSRTYYIQMTNELVPQHR